MRKVIKILFLFLILISIVALIEMISVSNKYINKSLITFDVNNIGNPQIKKLVRTIDNLYAYSLLKFSKEQKQHLDQYDENFESLPLYKTIPAKKNNFTITKIKQRNNSEEWERSHGNHASNRFSNLSQINLSNIKNLELAWKFEFGEVKRDIQANPVIANGKIFIPSPSNKVISIDALTGEKIWEFQINATPARRGMVFWSEKGKSLIYFCAEKNLISLDQTLYLDSLYY